MVSIYDVSPRELIEEAAKQLEKMPEMAPPEWASFVKTGRHNERPPAEKNWWYIRSAAVLRAIYKLGPIGVSKLRTKYGGRKNRGHKPDKTFKSGGNILRKIMQKLELIGFVKQAQVGVHKGRMITPQGKSFIDKIIIKIKPKYAKPKKAEKPEKAHEEKKPAAEHKKESVADKKEVPAKEEKEEKTEAKKAPEKKEKKEAKEEKPAEEKKKAETKEKEE
ncbi:30S ribosomal protein S19e [Candidatus Woesearchaeota archaeon]|nr:30S ribosomal protein S19e [Candidatus Woesearchaeota archaeon]